MLLAWGGGTPRLPQMPRTGWTVPWPSRRGGHRYPAVPREVAAVPLVWGPQPSPASPSWGSPSGGCGCCWLVVGAAPWGAGSATLGGVTPWVSLASSK